MKKNSALFNPHYSRAKALRSLNLVPIVVTEARDAHSATGS
ncbi:MAG TPA: hypothetical protein PKA63_09760 [Oligoflexia bacterium]|nr:hypothetical protein [Oligoflexia bacterium]HMP48940.1 hypothetical protein [Oligoflexia bacterium]